jgi:phosphate acyltransferase
MRLGLDIQGGDYAPKATIGGVKLALQEIASDDTLVLFGRAEQTKAALDQAQISTQQIEIIDAPDQIEMGEHPVKAFSRKPDSSIAKAFRALKNKEIDAFASAGNTGAMLVGSMYEVKTIPGIIRPALTSIVPKEKGGLGVLLDVGANADCKPDVLFQFGSLGSIYAEHVFQIINPKVALLNIGEEEEKGNLLSQAAYALMKDTNAFNFVGNVEGRDLFNDLADVIVCDGFTGNVALKLAEYFYVMTLKKGIKDEFFSRFNYENYGGSPILGINAPVIVGHGISNDIAIKNMILLSKNVFEAKLDEKIKAVFN